MTAALRVAIVGCGLIGRKRALALGGDALVGCFDVAQERGRALATDMGTRHFASLDELFAQAPDVVVATTNDALASVSRRALAADAHVLVEKPGSRSVTELEGLAAAAEAAGRLVKVGFNHRFFPGIARAVEEARSGRHGDVMFVRASYGHGGRVGYEREWRADPELAGGGELLDQGVHLLDLCHWLLGPLPLHSVLLRRNFWDIATEDNAVVVLGDEPDPAGPWAMFHVSWSEWKNAFALEIYCRRAKLQVTGLTGSYGPQILRIFTMRPEMGPPDAEEVRYDGHDPSWANEWAHFRERILTGNGGDLCGDLGSARYALECVHDAYRRGGFTPRDAFPEPDEPVRTWPR